MNHETLRLWVRRAEVDTGERPGVTSDERARIKELERENRELRRANEILKAASALFGAELIYRQDPWRGLDDVEFDTMTYVEWFNNRRLHGHITTGSDYTTPAEFEAAH